MSKAVVPVGLDEYDDIACMSVDLECFFRHSSLHFCAGLVDVGSSALTSKRITIRRSNSGRADARLSAHTGNCRGRFGRFQANFSSLTSTITFTSIPIAICLHCRGTTRN